MSIKPSYFVAQAMKYAVSATTSQNFSICNGDSVFLSGSYQTASGNYFDTLISINGCDSIVMSNLTVLVSALTTQIFSLCSGDSLLISGSYQTAAGNYFDTLTAINGCDSVLISTLILIPKPIANIAGEENICKGNNLTLTAIGGNNYLWNTMETSSSINVSPSTTTIYSVNVSNSCGSDKDSIQINVFPLPIPNVTTDTIIPQGSSIQISVSGGINYLWNTGEITSSIFISPVITTSYIVTVTDNNNCSIVDTITVEIDINCSIDIPNIFSPNNDGNNDALFVHGKCVEHFTLFIYNRWGEKIFETNELRKGWDGTFKGNSLNSAVFVYYITGSFTNGNDFKLKGNITLMK